MTIVDREPAAATEQAEYTWVGKSVPRKEDPRLLTGRAQLRRRRHGPRDAARRGPAQPARPCPDPLDRHQRARSALPGVVAVLTGADGAELIEPMPAFCAEPVPQHAIAVERVRFPGEAVAAVAATSRYIAEDACALIDVEYELLPPIVDPVAAMEADAPRVHDTLDSNVVFQRSMDFGDVGGDFARAAHVIRRTARWHRMGAQPMETAGAVARTTRSPRP